MDLPIPDIIQAWVPTELVQFSAREDIRELGEGIGFGSRKVENVDELAYLFIEQVDAKLRAKILLYDWWICNTDRTLSDAGGNVNLLWTHRDSRLHVIDHNLAFDIEGMAGFWDEHVFRESAIEWTSEFRAELEPMMELAAKALPEWWRQMPESWTEVPCGLNLQGIESLLWRFDRNKSKFWRSA